MTKKAPANHVNENYKSFKKLLPAIINIHRNKYALMRNRKIDNFYSTLEDAVSTGQKFYPDNLYSVQKVTDEMIDLGFFSHAIFSRKL